MATWEPEVGRSLESLTLDPETLAEPFSERPYGIYPYNKFRRGWEYVIFFLSLVCLWQLPYEFAFNVNRTFLYILPALLIDLFFLIDIFVVLRTGTLQYGVMHLDKETIRRTIPRWRLIISFLSPWPYYLVGFFLHDDNVFNALLLLKALRFFRLYDAVRVISNTLVYLGPISRMMILFGVWLTIAHFAACAFWYAGWAELPGDSWLLASKILGHPKSIQYFYALYYITTSSLTIGYGDVHPVTFEETCIALVVELVGVFFYNFIVSNLVSIVADPSRNSFLSKYQRVSSAFQQHHVSQESMEELLKYYEYVWERDRDRANFYETVTKLPLGLQKRLALALHMDVFTRVNALRRADAAALEKVAMALRQRVFTPGDCLLRIGKVSNRMFFVTAGKVSIVAENGEIRPSLDGARGAVLGDRSVLDGEEEPESAIAETYVEAFELLKADFDEVAAAHPEVQEGLGRRNRATAGR